jgi:hypothetical protein
MRRNRSGAGVGVATTSGDGAVVGAGAGLHPLTTIADSVAMILAFVEII